MYACLLPSVFCATYARAQHANHATDYDAELSAWACMFLLFLCKVNTLPKEAKPFVGVGFSLQKTREKLLFSAKDTVFLAAAVVAICVGSVCNFAYLVHSLLEQSCLSKSHQNGKVMAKFVFTPLC